MFKHIQINFFDRSSCLEITDQGQNTVSCYSYVDFTQKI